MPMIPCTTCKATNPDDAKFCYQCGKPVQASDTATQQAPLSFLTLTCPSCGGSMKINPQQGDAVCPNCGITHMVVSGGGMITLRAVEKVHAQVQQLHQTTQQIEQHLAGSGENLNQQSAAYLQNAQVMSLTQELLTARKDLKKQKDLLVLNPSNLVWMIPFLIWGYIKIPDLEGFGDYATAVQLYVLFFGILLVICCISLIKPYRAAKNKIPGLEKRVAELEKAIKAAGGSLGN